MFKIGDKIVYPLHGAGTITNIEKKKILGEIHEYYVLNMPIDNMRVMIPVDNLSEVGIRPISSEAEADAVIELFMAYEENSFEPNWNKRYRDNIDRMKSGSLADIARITKALLIRDKKKALSNAERKMLSNAEHILLSELVLSKNMKYDELRNLLFLD